MIKDLSQSLVAAVNEINQKSREQYITERNALNEKMAAKAMKMPKQPEPKADPAAHTGAAGMAKKNMGEAAEGSTPRNAKEKELAKLHGNPKKITHGDVLKGRGVVRKEAWEDMLKAVKEKGTGKFDKKETKPGVTRYTRKSSTYDDGGQDKDVKLANDKRKMYIRSNEEVKRIVEYFDKELAGRTSTYTVHSVDPEQGHYTATHRKTKEKHDIYIDDQFPDNTHESVHKDTHAHLKGTNAESHSSEIAKHIHKHISYGQDDYKTKNEEVQQVDELSYETLDRYKRAARKDMYKMQGPDGKPSEKNKEKHAKRVAGYRKAWHKQEDMKENKDTPGNSTHQCAIHVKSEQYGEGKTLTSQHAEPDQNGHIEWYDVMFAEGIKRVMTSDIEVLVSESHMNHKKKGKM